MRGEVKTGKWKNVVLGKMKVLVINIKPENSGIDSSYDFT